MERLWARDKETMGVFYRRDPFIREKLSRFPSLSLPANPPDGQWRAGNQFFLPRARGLMAFSAVLLSGSSQPLSRYRYNASLWFSAYPPAAGRVDRLSQWLRRSGIMYQILKPAK